MNISKVIFPLITAPYVSRVLEPDGVGLFNFATTYANWFALFAALGIPYYGIREIAQIKESIEKQTRFVSEIISISILSSLLYTFVFFLTLLFIPQLNENYKIFIIAAIVLYFTPIKIEWFFSGKEEFGYITLRSLIIKTLSVILLFLLVKTKDDLLTYVAIYAISVVTNDIWNFIKLYRSGIHPYFTLSLKKHLKPLLILFSSSIAIYVYTALDTMMLGFICDYTEVGYYNCATHISKAIIPIVTSLAAVALPRVAQYKKEKRIDDINTLLKKSFLIVGFLSVPISFGIISVAPTFVPLFFGSQYTGTILPLQIIILTVVVVGYNNLTGVQILLSFGLDKYFLYSIVAGTISSFTINIILIPLYGAIGAAISSVIAESVVLLFMLYFIYKYTPVRFMECKYTFATILTASSFFLISSYLFSLFNGWIGIIVVIVACSILYLIVQYIINHPSEKELLVLVLRKIRK